MVDVALPCLCQGRGGGTEGGSCSKAPLGHSVVGLGGCGWQACFGARVLWGALGRGLVNVQEFRSHIFDGGGGQWMTAKTQEHWRTGKQNKRGLHSSYESLCPTFCEGLCCTRFNLSACCICQVIVTWHKRPKQFVFHCNPIESTWFQELARHNAYLTTVAGEGYRIPRLLVLPHMSECLVSHSRRLCFPSPGTSSREEERLPWIRTKGDALSRSQGPALGHRRFFEGRRLGFIKELLARLYHIYTCYVVYNTS